MSAGRWLVAALLAVGAGFVGFAPAQDRKPTAPETPAAPAADAKAFEVERIDAIEAEVKHDVIAFLTNVAEHVGPDARFLHQGMTSSDVLDTCLAVQLARAADLLLEDLDGLLALARSRAE